MKRIVFVDDDDALLNGLRNVLRKQRHRWDMVFARGAEAALDALREGPCDLVVSDMRMPGMDGPALLRRVKEEQPSALRIILSGYAERESQLKVLSLAHQFLHKPCDVDVLLATLERALALQSLLDRPPLKCAVHGLPPVPEVYWNLAATRLDPARLASTLNHLETTNGPLLARLALLADLPIGAAGKEVHDRLGLDALCGMILMTQVLEAPERERPAFLRYCHVSGRVASRLAPPCQASDAFLAGLLHDVGLALMVPEAPEQVQSYTHGELMAAILLCWGFPWMVVEAVAHHTTPSAVTGGNLSLLTAVHVAGAVTQQAMHSTAPPGHELDATHVQRTGLGDPIEVWRKMAEREVALYDLLT